jgi:tetratricopeptide (TPR) repeat protein
VGPVNEQSEHLSNAQIENYGNRTSGAGSDADQPDEALRINAHLESCPSCRSHLLYFHRASFGLLADPQQLADVQVNTASTPECPSDDALRHLADGLTPDDVATKLTRHAATCDHCGPLLKTYTEDFSDDFSPEEQVALANLQSASAAWQKNTARQMMEAGAVSATAVSASKSERESSAERPASSVTSRRPFFWRWALVPATTAVVAVAAFSIWYTQRDTPEKVEKLFAQAYTEQRTMELRWPGAEWGPVRITRGSQDSKPASLFRAQVIIGQHNTSSNDVDWLRAKARSEIMDWNPRAAITLLERALGIAGKPTAIQLDLSSAYFQMGELSHDPQNYEKALGLIRAVLKEDTKSRTALYNRALLDERLNRVDDAAKDWQVVLNTESDPQWLREADLKYKALVKSR